MALDLRDAAAAIDRATQWPGLTHELAGAQFGRLTVSAPAPIDASGHVRVFCRCACGRLAVRRVADLREGRAVACRVCAPPPRRKKHEQPLRLRDPEAWERKVELARERRRELRANPEYRDREAEWARAYRQRHRSRCGCAVCGRALGRGRRVYCGPRCAERGKVRRARAWRRAQKGG